MRSECNNFLPLCEGLSRTLLYLAVTLQGASSRTASARHGWIRRGANSSKDESLKFQSQISKSF